MKDLPGRSTPLVKINLYFPTKRTTFLTLDTLTACPEPIKNFPHPIRCARPSLNRFPSLSVAKQEAERLAKFLPMISALENQHVRGSALFRVQYLMQVLH
jgi:hypothetical protein